MATTMQEYLEEMARRQATGWTPGVPTMPRVSTAWNLPSTARTTMRQAVPKANLGDISAQSNPQSTTKRKGRPRTTTAKLQSISDRANTGTLGKTVKAIAPFAKLAGPLGLASFAYDALRPSQLAMADEPTDVPGYSLSENFPAGLGGGYISPTADDTVVGQAVPVPAQVPETKWSELVATFTPSTYTDTFKPGGRQAGIDYLTSPIQAILGSSDVESGEPYSGMGDAPGLVSTGHPGMGMGGGYDLSDAGMSTVDGFELAGGPSLFDFYPDMPMSQDKLDLLDGMARDKGWKDYDSANRFGWKDLGDLPVGNVLPISLTNPIQWFNDDEVNEEMKALVDADEERFAREVLAHQVDDFSTMNWAEDPVSTIGGLIKDPTAPISLPAINTKPQEYISNMPVLPLQPVPPRVGPISSDPGPTKDEIDAIIERTVTAPAGNLERIAAAKSAAKNKRASDLARQKKAAADKRAADRAVAQAVAASAAQAKTAQKAAKAVLSRMGNDRNRPSDREIAAAIEVMSGVDSFGSGGMRNSRGEVGMDETGYTDSSGYGVG